MPLRNIIHLVFFADTHLGFDYPIRPKIKRRRRGQDFFDNYRRVLEFAIDSKADLVIHGGDFFFRTLVPKKIVDLAYEPLLQFAEHGIPIFIVPGNHERSQLPISLFLTHPNIHVFDKPGTFTLDLAGTRIAISGFPFERNGIRDRFKSILDESGWTNSPADIRLLSMHQAVEGAQVGPSNYTFRYGRDVIGINDLPADFHAVLSGHIHRKQILRKPNTGLPVIYPGSTERTSFAEKSEEKGFFEIILRRFPDKNWEIQNLNFIKLPARPMHDLFLDFSVNAASLRSYILARIAKFDEDSIVRLRCNGNLDNQVRGMLTSPFLREIIPESMNFQFSSDFYRFRNGPKGQYE
jgi:DNA repair exonuclease SbcCD nuclease subunit